MPHGRKRAAASWPNRRSRHVDPERLTYMTNQIARNFAAQGEEAAIAAIAQHIRDYWDPRMKEDIRRVDQAELIPAAAAAIRTLSEQDAEKLPE